MIAITNKKESDRAWKDLIKKALGFGIYVNEIRDDLASKKAIRFQNKGQKLE